MRTTSLARSASSNPVPPVERAITMWMELVPMSIAAIRNPPPAPGRGVRARAAAGGAIPVPIALIFNR